MRIKYICAVTANAIEVTDKIHCVDAWKLVAAADGGAVDEFADETVCDDAARGGCAARGAVERGAVYEGESGRGRRF